MFEYVSVSAYLLTSTLSILALELDLRQKVPRNSVDLVELTVASAVRTVVGILCEPMALAVSTDWLLADFAL